MKKKTTKLFSGGNWKMKFFSHGALIVALFNLAAILWLDWSGVIALGKSSPPEESIQQKEESKPRHLSKVNGYSIVCLEGVSYWQGGHLNGVSVSLTPRYNRQGKIVWCEPPGEKL